MVMQQATDRLFDRKIGRLGTPEYLVHGAGRASELFDVARHVTLEVLWSTQSPARLECHRRPLLHPLGADALPRDPRQTYLRAKRRMISLNIGSVTFSAAASREPLHNAFLFFRPLFILAPDFRGKTRTSQTTTPPFLIRFSYENEPNGALGNRADNPSLFESFTRSELPGRLALFSASPSE